MSRKVGHVIHDILETIDRVEKEVSSRSFGDFQHEWTFRFAVQRAIEIISEASRHLPEHLKATRPEIHWRSIAGIGNILRHDYQSTSDKVIWDVVHESLPPPKTAVEPSRKLLMNDCKTG